MPGEILRSFLTSEDLSHWAGCSAAGLPDWISCSSALPKLSKSLFVTTWWFNNSMLSISGKSFFGCKFIMKVFDLL